MKWLITLLSKWIFGQRGGTIRIDADHLPGLRAPKTKPRYPIDYPKPQAEPGTDIESLYWKFYKSIIGKPLPKKPINRGDFDFK